MTTTASMAIRHSGESLPACRAFGELSRAVVERRREQAAEESSGLFNPFLPAKGGRE